MADSSRAWSLFGVCTAGVYVVVVVAVFVYTASNSKPENVGYDWIPFLVLTVPWLWVGNRIDVPLGITVVVGFVLNVILLYLLGAVVGRLRAR